MQIQHAKRYFGSSFLRLILFTLCLSSHSASATIFNWNVASGNWTTSTSWSPNGVPGSSDFANIGSIGSGNETATLSGLTTQSVSLATVGNKTTGNVLNINNGATLTVTNNPGLFGVSYQTGNSPVSGTINIDGIGTSVTATIVQIFTNASGSSSGLINLTNNAQLTALSGGITISPAT